MTNKKDIQAQINELEKKREALLMLRKEEIFEVLNYSGGLTLDNKLIAGLAVYASNPSNTNSPFLRELEQLGKKKIPSKNRSISKKTTKTDQVNRVCENAVQEA